MKVIDLTVSDLARLLQRSRSSITSMILTGMLQACEAEQIRVENAFPGLIDRKTFEAVQQRLRSVKRTGRYRNKDRQRYPLSGLVYCGCCDGKMHGQHTSRRKNGKIYEWNKYKCGTNLKHGHKDKYADGCYHCQVDDGQLTRFVADSLQRQLTPANLKRLEEALTRKASKPQRTPDVSSLKRKLSKLGTDIDKAADRLLRADDDLMDILSPRLREMREEMAAWRDGFLAAKEGEEQTAEKLRQKEKTWQRYFAQGERFPPFLGRMTDVLHVEGLTGPEGNQHISYEMRRPEGGGQFGSRWRRNADVTLFVPKCTAVLLRGCQMGIDVSGLETQLMLTAIGSQNRDYNGQFAIRNHIGDITYSNVPMDVIEHVVGNVNITATTEMSNTGGHHSSGNWTLYTPAPRRLTLSDISGTLTARFTRSDLHVNGVAGVLNIRNDFGDSHCSIRTPLIAASHRIVSQSGLVNVKVEGNTKLNQPVFAATSCGTAATNLGRDELDDLNVTFTSGRDRLRHQWRVLHTKLPQGDFSARIALHQRPDDILENRERTHGLDLLSVAGRVEYLAERAD